MPTKREIGNTVLERRRRAGLTQDELASLVPGLSQSRVCRVELGKATVPAELRSALAQVLHVDPCELAPGTPDHTCGAPGTKPFFCENPKCASARPIDVGQVWYLPTVVYSKHERPHCRICGHVMVPAECRACPGESFSKGAFCERCGRPYISASLSQDDVGDVRRWVLREKLYRSEVQAETGIASRPAAQEKARIGL